MHFAKLRKDEIPDERRDSLNPNLWKQNYVSIPIPLQSMPSTIITNNSSNAKSIFIYVLLLDYNKYYVGKTNNPQFRFEQHFTTNSTAWTTKYKPLKLHELLPDCDDYDEDKHTLRYMAKYGIDNVRGGSYSKLILDSNEIQFITKRLDSATDKCYKCGVHDHFAKDCIITIDDNTSSSLHVDKLKVFNCKYCNKEFSTFKGTTYHENLHCKSKPSNTKIPTSQLENKVTNVKTKQIQPKLECYRCGREGHHSNDCYAKTTINGDIIIESSSEEILVYYCSYCNKEFDTLKGATCHENLYCSLKNNSINQNCYRCGRKGHFSNNCYATKHMNGKYLG